jgi:ABC-2 type transport system ATP-binding protein
VIELSQIEVRFLAVRALKGIDLSIAAGEIVGYVGPNGAGKTTTLNVAATLLRPNRGQVRLNGADAFANLGSSRAQIGYMPESFGVYDDMTVSEYLRFFGRAYHLPDSRCAEVSERSLVEAGLADVATQTVAGLSKGMKQRLFFIKTFLHDPALVLLDEPFSGLDPIACRIVREKIQAEAHRGKAFLIASHDLAELEASATRVIAIRDGLLLPFQPSQSQEAEVCAIRVAADVERAITALRQRFPTAPLRRSGAATILIEMSRPGEERDILAALLEAEVSIASFVKRGTSLSECFEREFGGGAREA